MNFRKASDSDKQQIYNLWKKTFGDSETVIDRFFESVLAFENVILCCDGEKAVSMLSLMPAKIVSADGQKSDAYCVYAAATDEEYRKRGIMSKLLDFSAELAAERNADFLFLHPANEKLYSYYEKSGFEKAFFLGEQKQLSEIDDDFSYSYVDWDKNILKLNAEFSDNCSFFCEYGYADYSEHDGRIIVNTFFGGNVKALLNALSEYADNKNVYVSLPSEPAESVCSQGMIRRLSGKKFDVCIYLGISLE